MVRQGGVHEGAGWLSEHRYPPRWITRQKGCYRHRWVERNWPRDGEETDRKGLSRGCELSEHYVRYGAPWHSRSETGGRRHWYRESDAFAARADPPCMRTRVELPHGLADRARGPNAERRAFI